MSYRQVTTRLVREYQELNDSQVEYRDKPTALDFSRIVRSNRPVVFRDCISHWPALRRWKDPEYLRETMGDQEITVAETPNGYAHSQC
jgi:jumonji domain-containing protein 7